MLLLCTLPLLQVNACIPTAISDSFKLELVSSASEFVFTNAQTIFQNWLGV
jgi:hypothetical protein